MAKRVMKESAAWRKVGRNIEKAETVRAGLCFEGFRLFHGDDRDAWPRDGAFPVGYDPTYVAMKSRADFHVGYHGFAYRSGSEWEARCLAAYWLALEAAGGGL